MLFGDEFVLDFSTNSNVIKRRDISDFMGNVNMYFYNFRFCFDDFGLYSTI